MLPHRVVMRKPCGDMGCNKTRPVFVNKRTDNLCVAMDVKPFHPFFHFCERCAVHPRASVLLC